MLNEKDLLNKVHEDLICHSAALRKVFNFPNGELMAVEANIDYIVNGKRMFITYIPYDYDGENIDLRIRKRLAKQFIEMYTLEKLKAEYIAELDKQEEEEKRQLEVFEKTKLLLEKLNKVLYRFKSAEAKMWATGSQIVAEYIYKDYTYRDINVSHTIEIRIAGNGYTVNHKYSNDIYSKNDLYNFNNLHELETFIIDTLYPIFDKAQAEAEERLEDHRKEQEKENQLERLLFDIASGKSWYVLKSKRTYTAISGSTKYSLKAGGKFQNTNYKKVREDIKNGKIEAYAIVPNNEWADRKTYLELEYISF